MAFTRVETPSAEMDRRLIVQFLHSSLKEGILKLDQVVRLNLVGVVHLPKADFLLEAIFDRL
jgi:hypothetical protein